MLNSRERVLCAIAGEEPDRVPSDFSANAPTLSRLHNDLGTRDHRELLEALRVDIVDLRGVVDPAYCGPIPLVTVDARGVKRNHWGWRTRTMDTATGPEECFCEFILGEATTVEGLEQHTWPKVDWFDLDGFAERLRPWREFAIMASGASVFQHPTFLRGLETLLADMLTAPEMADYLMGRYTDFYVAYFDRLFSAAPGQIDILRIADDLGMQDRLLISPSLFDRFFAPRLAALIDMAHSHGVVVMFHSCGAIVPLVERLIALGVDILDPLQVRAKGMKPAAIKAAFGDRVCLHGGVDTQYLLPKGTPEQVRSGVRELIDILGPEGYIVAPSHVLQTDVPTENILALYETARRHGMTRF